MASESIDNRARYHNFAEKSISVGGTKRRRCRFEPTLSASVHAWAICEGRNAIHAFQQEHRVLQLVRRAVLALEKSTLSRSPAGPSGTRRLFLRTVVCATLDPPWPRMAQPSTPSCRSVE